MLLFSDPNGKRKHMERRSNVRRFFRCRVHSCAKITKACERATTWLRISAAKWSLRSHLDLTAVQHRVAERPRIDFVAQAPGRPARVRWLRAAVILMLAGSTAPSQPATANPAPLGILRQAGKGAG